MCACKREKEWLCVVFRIVLSNACVCVGGGGQAGGGVYRCGGGRVDG